MRLKFFKYQATGNDFVMINGFDQPVELSQDQIRKLCDRHFGIGSDGLVILRPEQSGDFFMDFYNPDGSQAGFCGNGGRCSVLMARDIGLIGDQAFFHARDGEHDARVLENGQVLLRLRDVHGFKDFGTEVYVNTGTHHVVVFVDNVEEVDIVPLARRIRYATRYRPEGTNVNFVQVMGDSSIKIRTYEKGVEAETLSCGTGVVASALVSAYREGFDSPIGVETRGGKLKVFFDRRGTCYENVYLQGPVNQVFVGEIEI